MSTEDFNPAVIYVYSALMIAGIAFLAHHLFYAERGNRLGPDNALVPWKLKSLDLALILTFIYLFIFGAGALTIEGYNYIYGTKDIIPEHDFIFGFPMHIAILASLYGFFRYFHINEVIPINPIRGSPMSLVLSAIYFFLAGLPILMLGDLIWPYALEFFQLPVDPQELVTQVQSMSLSLEFLMVAFLAVILAPISEELLFRAFIYRSLKAYVPASASAIITSLLFAGMHFNWLSFLPLFILGLWLCRVYEQSRNLWVPIILHGLFNGKTLVLFDVDESSVMNPFSDTEAHTVKHLGERQLIQQIVGWLGTSNPPTPTGIGDDAALLNLDQGNWVITKDSLVYNKHFDESTPAELAGAKLLNRNISDIAAMGARPTYALIACLLPPTTSTDWLHQFYVGLKEVAHSSSVLLVGGDISSTFQDLAFTLTLLGSGKPKALTRKSANPQDSLWVTGMLGGSLLGKHLYFKPRLKEGLWLAEQSGVTSAMDVSDGLATDLQNLCPSNCHIELDTDSLPISSDAKVLGKQTGKHPIEHALIDGEDYELLFTLDSDTNEENFLSQWGNTFSTPLTKIGQVIEAKTTISEQIRYTGTLSGFKNSGYEHF